MPLTVDWTDLEARSRALLDQARVLLEGPTSNYEGGSARSAPDSRAPITTGTPTLEVMAQTMQAAGQGEELLRAIHWAEVQLYRARHARRRSRPADSPERIRARVLREWTGSSPEEVAAFEPCTVAQICHWRADVGREPLTGRAASGPPSTSWQTPEERALRVQQLRAAHPHLSSRALGIMVGTSHVTVLSDLRRPADQGL
jgi:hypothetical protein